MTVDAGDVIKITARMQNDVGTVIENVYYVMHQGATSVSDVDFVTAALDWINDIYGLLTATISNTVDPLDVIMDVVEFSGSRVVTVRSLGTMPWGVWAGGTASSDALPSGTAAVVTFPTLIPGVRGRKFIGILTEANHAAGILSGASVVDLTLYGLDVVAGFVVGAQTFGPVVMSTKLLTAVALAQSIVRTIVGYQRRRKTGVGI